MDNSWITDLFANIAGKAFDRGLEISLELKDYSSRGGVLNGAFSNSESSDNGLIMRAYKPSQVWEGEE